METLNKKPLKQRKSYFATLNKLRINKSNLNFAYLHKENLNFSLKFIFYVLFKFKEEIAKKKKLK